METTLHQLSVATVLEGFHYNELEGKGLYGLNGKLTIQPEFQRNYIEAGLRQADRRRQGRRHLELPDLRRRHQRQREAVHHTPTESG